MAAKNKLEVVASLPKQSNNALETSLDASENLTLEQIVADELLDSLDWKAVNKALLEGIQRRFIRWFTTGNSASMIATNEIEAEALAIGPGEDNKVAA